MRRPVSWLATRRIYLQPARLLVLMHNGIWTDKVAYSCEGSRGLEVGFTVSRVPVSALSGHRSMKKSLVSPPCYVQQN